MTTQYLLAIDQGTSSSRTVIYDECANVISSAQQEFRQIYPEPGWVEHDAEEIWTVTCDVVRRALETAGGPRAVAVEGIGITNQRETNLIWDKATGKPCYNAIVWQDRRTSEFCDELKAQGHAEVIQQKTGLVLDAYFSATKIGWILDNVDGVREAAEAGREERLIRDREYWQFYAALFNGNGKRYVVNK